ncbi:glycosyltransferase 87 family protein [Kribbella solani]|uniref:glycosyltransferase 87 family protein n=1 Tax=Kribbella solani TaxID=236067 RepID=UPI0029A9FF7E|nr:glycosyltransferase 87 family protein [Kribbella solani]MDX2968484.1 glycosyltransferase 87 family protein [Kribbella solani]MDX3003843.1 glycosyltransferase 87 family protein [Kribbella solani]
MKYELMLRRLLYFAVAITPVIYIVYSGNIDLNVYRTGGYALLHDLRLYADDFPSLVPGFALPFTYPPFAAMLFVPLHLVPRPLADLMISTASVIALTATMLVVARRLLGTTRIARYLGLAVVVLAMFLQPVRSNVGFAQVNLILMGLVAVDCLITRPRWPRGVLIGLAAAIKLTPLVFILYFLVRRQYREAATVLGTFAGISLVAYALRPIDSTAYWFGVLFSTDRIGGATYAFNQCFQAVVHRLVPDGPLQLVIWFVLVLAALVPTLIAARKARANGDDVTALLVVAVFGLLASPVSWSHHWVWIAPAVLAIGCHAWRKRNKLTTALSLLVVATFAVGPHVYLDPEGRHWNFLEHLLGSSYVLIGVAYLVTLAARKSPHVLVSQRLNSEARIR